MTKYQIYLKILKEKLPEKNFDILVKKSLDYSDSLDPFSSFKQTVIHLEKLKVHATVETIIMFNIAQKQSRIKNLKDKKANFESIEDSQIDLDNYQAILEAYKLSLARG